jgi:Uma2 family endonuclease
MAALRIRLSSGKFREPDLIMLRSANDPRRHDRFWDGADLVVEVVSDGAEDRYRDLVTKREEYAQAGIPEYWIVDPQNETIAVLTLSNHQYADHGVFARAMTATSPMFSDLRIDVSAVFDAE